MFTKYLFPIYFLYFINLIKYYLKYKSFSISPKSFLKNVKVWKNVMICWWIKIDNCTIWDYSYISWAESWWIISRFSNVEIWRFCSIAHNVDFINHSHHSNHISSYPFYSSRNSPFFDSTNKIDTLVSNTKVWNDVWIWAYVKIIWNVTIWDWTIIAAWSVVTKDIPPYCIVWWVPAKIIRYRFSEKYIKYLLDEKWWDKSIDEINNILPILNNTDEKIFDKK